MPTETPLLSTKLFLPLARDTLVPRPRLITHFDDGLTRPLTLVAAPAGSGKTTLISEWRISERGRAHALAWLSLDPDDNDPVRFLTYLIAALATARPGFGEAARALLNSAQPPAPKAILAYLIDELGGLDAPLALVLDDYHVITAQPVHETVAFLLDHRPPLLHLVILTRADPPLPLARLRARDQLAEIRAADLRFTTVEAAAFLNQNRGLSLSPADVEALEARTEGWIAGLQLAALALKGRGDVASFVKAFTGSHAYVAEYLIEEVLQRQPEPVQTFLLETSILERMSANLCQSVTGRPDGPALLADLNRTNLFVIPLDEDGHWYRYHHLFADLLQARLRLKLPDEGMAALHQRATAWFEQNGLVAEAITHALAAKDYDGAARLIEQNMNALMASGQLATLLQWIEALPAAVMGHHPLLSTSAAWVFTFSGAVARVEPLLRQALAQLSGDPETPLGREVRGNVATVRALLAMMAGDDRQALDLARSAEALLPESSVQARSLLPYTLGTSLRAQGQYEPAAQAFARVVELGKASGDLLIWSTGITEMVNTRLGQGRLHEAREVGNQALRRLAERGAVRLAPAAKIEVALCEVLREQDELIEARQRVAAAIERMQGWDMPTDQLFGYLTLAHTCRSQSDFAGAYEALHRAKDLQAAHPILEFLTRSADLLEIQLSLATQDVVTAGRLVESLGLSQPARASASRSLRVREQEQLTLARVRLVQGRAEDAASLLGPLANDAEVASRLGAFLEIQAVQACRLDQQGDREAAVTLLIKTLGLAEPEGFVRVFADEGPPMKALLGAVARQVDSIRLKTYVAGLLDASRGSPATATTSSQGPAPGQVERLTPRELQVLQLIAAGNSNQSIADKLVITVSAVKKHTSNVFGKLSVGSRTQALARARELGLL